VSERKYESDLLVLTADRSMKAAVQGALLRPHAIGIRHIQFNVDQSTRGDGWCRAHGVSHLAGFANRFNHAILMFDLDGCGSADDRTTLEGILKRQLSNRWGNRAAAIVIDPELDIWAWGGMFHLASAVNWKVEKSGNLNQWLIERKLIVPGQPKPLRPKEVLDAVLHEAHTPRSSSLFEMLAEKVSLGKCEDPAFFKFRTALQHWFSKP
jgi:hypothetical protein